MCDCTRVMAAAGKRENGSRMEMAQEGSSRGAGVKYQWCYRGRATLHSAGLILSSLELG